MSALRTEDEDAHRHDGEDLDAFRARARAFIRSNLRQVTPEELRWDRGQVSEEAELASVTRDREIQRMLYDAGFAGLCFPRAYGGQGLTPDHQRVFNEEIVGFEYPVHLQVPTLSPCALVLLEFGTEEQKLRHLPPILRGEELWMQFLFRSRAVDLEPSRGRAATSAVRDGEQWVLNGSKVWTTGAWWSDWGLCLARTNWDVPKHRGLTVFMLPIHQPAIEVHRIEMLNGSREFCQEFMTDVIVPDSDRIGAVDDGWTVGTRWMFHERMLYSTPYVTEPIGIVHGSMDASAVLRKWRNAALSNLRPAQSGEPVGEGPNDRDLVNDVLSERIREAIRSGKRSDQAAAIVRLYKGDAAKRIITLAFEVAGAEGAAWSEGSAAAQSAINFLMRQAGSIGGGTTEMAKNVISERVLGMPRERRLDKDVPFRDVPRSPSTLP